MQATIRWAGAVRFEAEAGSGAALTLDGPPESGGQGAGARPMELLLIGTGGCASYDVVHILRNGRHDVVDCVCTLEADRAPEPPRVFTAVRMHFTVTGRGLSEAAVARAVQLSAEKYCSASIMLGRAGVAVSHTHAVVQVEEGA